MALIESQDSKNSAGNAAKNRRAGAPAASGLTPEALVPRIGDTLVERGLLKAEDLKRALEYQQANAFVGNPRLLGDILVELRMITREQLDQAITEQFIGLQEALKKTNETLEQRVQERTADLERRLAQIHTVAEVTQAAISANSLGDLLKLTVNLIVERLGYYYAAIFLVDENKKFAALREATGTSGAELKQRGYKLSVGSHSIIGWVTNNNQARIISDVADDPLYLQDELLPQTRSEACMPLAIGGEVLGALDVQSTDPNAFTAEDVALLQTFGNQIALAIRNMRALETTQVNLQELDLLYRATQTLGGVEDAEQIFEILGKTLHQTDYVTLILRATPQGLRVASVYTPEAEGVAQQMLGQVIPVTLGELSAFTRAEQRYWLINKGQPFDIAAAFNILPQRTACATLALMPIRTRQQLRAMLILGSPRSDRLLPVLLQPYLGLVEFVATALEKIEAMESTRQRLASLQMLNNVSQAIATETNLEKLYARVHQQVNAVMGEVDFYIALYDAINQRIDFPYFYEDRRLRVTASIPFGQGLTSVVLRTRHPLRLVEDVEKKSAALGAVVAGKFSKSWLGVPLIIGEEVIGVMTAQHAEIENFFDEEDERLLSTLAYQVAVAIRNARLLNEAEARAQSERFVAGVTSKLWAVTDPEIILQTALRELSRAFDISEAYLDLEIQAPDSMENRT
ncbi:MAG: hypothetical protein OHK0052_00070 [Anaerolineales bacterium]